MVDSYLDDEISDEELEFEKKSHEFLTAEDHEGIDGPQIDHSFLFSEQFPAETDFVNQFWIADASWQGFYTRSAYFDRWDDWGTRKPKWRPSKFPNPKTGERSFSRFDKAARRCQLDKHLGWQDYLQVKERWFQQPLRNLETAHWLGTLPGPTTRSDALDLDSHTVVGFYTLPTQDGTWRELPVPKCELAFFQIMKRLHDAFPDRIWMTSSANLGKGLWRLLPQSIPTHHVERQVEKQLKDIGLVVEHFPIMPKSKNSLGKCHRRPFGLDSALHTEDGLIVTPLRQIRYLMEFDATISWPTLFHQHLDQMRMAYDLWEKEDRQPSVFAKEAIDEEFRERPKEYVLKELREDIDRALEWFEKGSECPTSEISISHFEEQDQKTELTEKDADFNYGKIVEFQGKPHVVIPRKLTWTLPTKLQLKVQMLHGMFLIEPKFLEQQAPSPISSTPIPQAPKSDSKFSVPETPQNPVPMIEEKSVDQLLWEAFESGGMTEEEKSVNQLLWEAFEGGGSTEGIRIVHSDPFPFSSSESDSHFWSDVKKLAIEGVPEPDKLHEYLLDLAAPLYWREHFSLPESQRVLNVFNDLLFWVQQKHNGHVSRLSNSSGRADIERQIQNRIETVANCGEALQKFYAQMRMNDSRFPNRFESLSGLIRNRKGERVTNQHLSHCKCMGVEELDFPLPAGIENQLKEIVLAHPKLVSKGKCVFVEFARRLLNSMWKGKGKIHLNWQRLNGFRGKAESKDRTQVLNYKKLLAENDLIDPDWSTFARRGIASCRYRMTAKAMKEFEDSPDHVLASQNQLVSDLCHSEEAGRLIDRLGHPII